MSFTLTDRASTILSNTLHPLLPIRFLVTKWVRRSTGHVMVTTLYYIHIAINAQTGRDSNRDKIFARSNHPRTVSKSFQTFRRFEFDLTTQSFFFFFGTLREVFRSSTRPRASAPSAIAAASSLSCAATPVSKRLFSAFSSTSTSRNRRPRSSTSLRQQFSFDASHKKNKKINLSQVDDASESFSSRFFFFL